MTVQLPSDASLQDDDIRVSETVDTGITAADADSLKIHSDISKITVTPDNVDSITLDIVNATIGYSFSVNKGTFILETGKCSKKLRMVNSSEITVRLPEGMSLTKIDIETESADVLLENIDAPKVTVKTGMGNFKNIGTLSGSVSFNTSHGNADLTLGGTERDYSFNLDTDMGHVVVGPWHANIKTHGQGRHTGAAYTSTSFMTSNKISMKCSSGDITVSFK